ncbi:MAG: hypothetical protein Q8R13_03945 [bacterium]|nr:hypothetical protein [bacterium]MDZ4295976.1 hypothetical protein [Patescibacteria group bacterium]
MMKALVISDDPAVRAGTERIFRERLGFSAVVSAGHGEALGVFLAESPTHVVLDGYDEHEGGPEHARVGAVTYRDLVAAAQEGQRIVRCGWPAYGYPDYIQLPFLVESLAQALGVPVP